MRGGKDERGIGEGREGFSMDYFRRGSFGLVRDAHNQRNRNQALDFDSYKITALDSD
jgi:hypothetical protein